MRILEFRIIVPTNIEKYAIGNRYMNYLYVIDEKNGNEGIEIVKNEPYEKGDEKGRFTHKIYHIKSKIPGFIRLAIPDKYMHFHDESFNSYPLFLTTYKMPGMGDDFMLSIESQHIKYTTGMEIPDNIIGLDENDLKMRKIVYIDLINGQPAADPPEVDMHGYTCPEAGITEPIDSKEKYDPSRIPPWTNDYKGEMIMCIKVVKFNFKWRGLQTSIEKYVGNTAYPGIFANSHRKLMASCKDWYKLTMDDILRIEEEVAQNQNFEKEDKETDGKDKKDKKDKKEEKEKKNE